MLMLSCGIDGGMTKMASTCTHARAHTHTRTYTHKHMHTHTHTHTHTRAHRHHTRAQGRHTVVNLETTASIPDLVTGGRAAGHPLDPLTMGEEAMTTTI